MIDERDTQPAAGRAQRAVFRRLTSSERVAIALQMSDEMRQVAVDGLRHRRPGVSQVEIQRAVRRLMLGDALADRIDRSR